ncbi:AAA family ATPase [Mycolicibacterium neoaurum]|uniref:bifunctional aminoglycoside phosphotransferase/ATP-binding protein n=1 Tax=Mycolicibacterium neoaurum TaxID=1795 RepID=UPI00248B9D5D|nr:AAA family ATPase [Mycolicibacterium neoaurum]WBP96360.1 AAA family ATPase [Mycolicibacterium neoaurum]WBS10109.1 AAA family ATPase [Mycolicibacterium neoaurum]
MSAVSDWPPSRTTDSETPAAIHETHTGLVILFGDRAYKLKKPVVTDFLDFSTVDAREYVCRRELTLNRRIAPSSYLGIAHLAGSPDRADEPIIVMRRHPAARCLAALIAENAPVAAELDAIATRLAEFHRTADRGHRVDACATVEAVSARWRENLAELRRYTPDVLPATGVAELEDLFTEFVATRRDVFATRIDARRIVDGHGDLQAADIYCLKDGPALLDCLEFDDDLRHVDGIDDAAFLAMDLEFLGRRDLGVHFLDRYRRHAGDDAPPELVHFYIGYRATVRAKVDCIRVSQGHREAGHDARRHLTIALEHLRMAGVRLIIVGGGPGTGKTTLSRRLADDIGAQVLSTDDIRRELRDRGRIGGRPGTLQSGLYTRENVDRVYDEVFRRTQQLLAGGHTVVLDGTWRAARHRAAARAIAEDLTVPILEFVCTTSLDEARSRIARRGPTSSDATTELAEPLAPNLDDWVEAHRIDTGRPLQMSVAEARKICCTGI